MENRLIYVFFAKKMEQKECKKMENRLHFGIGLHKQNGSPFFLHSFSAKEAWRGENSAPKIERFSI